MVSEHKSLAEALSAFQAEMPTVAKTKTAKVKTKTGGEYSYSYADLADVTEAAMPLLSKHGLSFSALPKETEEGYELVGLLQHPSGDKIQGALPLAGATPQEIGSSITYMRRYLIGCLTGIVTDDDDDGQAASQPRSQPRPQAQAAPRTEGNGNGERLASAKQRGLIFVRAQEQGLSNIQLASIVLAATGSPAREFPDEDAAGEWLRRAMERLPAGKVNPLLEALTT